MVFALHGGSGTAQHMLKLVPDLQNLGERTRTLIVLPQGIGKSWNDGRTDPISEAHREQIPDAQFLTELALALQQRYAIPAGKIFTMGISNGGMMSLRLACDSPVFTGAVSVAGQMLIEYADKCRAPQKPRVLFILGVNDPLVPYDGGPVRVLGRRRGVVYSAARSAEFWIQKNGCQPTPEKSPMPDNASDETTSRREHWECPGSAVGVIHVDGGGHTWPGGDQYLPVMAVGRTSRDFSAAVTAFQWFGLDHEN